MISTTEAGIYVYVSSYAKIYPDMTRLFVYHTPIKVRTPGWEGRVTETTNHHKSKNAVENAQSDIDSIRRTRTRLRDLVASNEFDLFATFTFSDDRENIQHSKKKMSFWLENSQKRYGKFDYLIVPEFHKDKKAIHFHALINNYKGTLIYSGHKDKKGKKIYNIQGYKLGFTTAQKIETKTNPKIGSYISKYITKDMPTFKNKRRYWCSQGLIRPKKITNPNLDPKTLDEVYQNKKFTVYEKLNDSP